MSSSQLLSIATFIFGLAAFFYLAALIFTKPKLTPPAPLDRGGGGGRNHRGYFAALGGIL